EDAQGLGPRGARRLTRGPRRTRGVDDGQARRGAVGEARDRYGDQTASGLRAAARGRVRPQGLPAAVRVDGDPRQGLLAEPAQGPARSAVSGMAETNGTRSGLRFRDVTSTAACDYLGPSPASAPATLSALARIISTEANSDKPYLVFLQGGPGVEAPRPVTPVGADTWLARALADFQVVMLDQRGTGRSNPIGSTAGAITGLESVGEDASAIAEALA